MATDDNLHIVIETLCSNPAQMREGGNVLANRRGEVLVFDKVHVLAAGISQDITEGVNAPLSLRGEVDVVGGIVHLRLNAGAGFKPAHQFPRLPA